jgi:hypothetical protein
LFEAEDIDNALAPAVSCLSEVFFIEIIGAMGIAIIALDVYDFT